MADLGDGRGLGYLVLWVEGHCVRRASLPVLVVLEKQSMEAVLVGSRGEEATFGEISLAVAAVWDLMTRSGRGAVTLLGGQSLLF